MKYSKSEIEESLTKLREWIKPGDTVYTVLRHACSASSAPVASAATVAGATTDSAGTWDQERARASRDRQEERHDR